MTSRILIFSPYASRSHLTFYEGTIAKACQIRGATVEYLLCDGLLPECDNHWESFMDSRPRPFDLCRRCQARARSLLDEMGFEYRWLGEFVNETEIERAFDWAQNLSPFEMRQASFMGYPVGEWVLSSMVSYFRRYPPDMKNWRVVNVYRGFLNSAAIVAMGLINYLKAYSVDSALLFNGRQSLTRVAFEIYRQHGIRELTHEFPFYQRGHLMLKPNARCWSIEPFNEFWKMWRHAPLTRSSLEETLKWLQNRRYGNGLSWYAFNAPHLTELSVRQTLGLSPSKRLLALFTSSTDETAGDPELQGPYESQSEWVQDVVNWVRDREDVELVIRVHPHLGGKTGLGKAVDEYSHYLELNSNLPANTRIIMPDDSINSYALMDEADICLSFGSSVGLEMAMLGKPVVLGSRAIYEESSHILNIRSKKSLPEMLEKSLDPPSTREIQREAFRLAFYYVFKFELPFPLVSMPEVMNVKLNYTGPESLTPGQDATLDQICGYLIDGQQLFDSPTVSELERTTDEEDAFFAELEQLKEPLRDFAYEQSVQRTYWMNMIGRSTQKVVQRLPLGIGYVFNKVGKAAYMLVMRIVAGKS